MKETFPMKACCWSPCLPGRSISDPALPAKTKERRAKPCTFDWILLFHTFEWRENVTALWFPWEVAPWRAPTLLLVLWSWMLPGSPSFPGSVDRDPHAKACQVLGNDYAMTVISFPRVLKKNHLNFRVSCLLTTHFHTSPLRQPVIWTQHNSLELGLFSRLPWK